MGGKIPATNGQFSNRRVALLLKPGIHDLNVNIGYYTQVMGLGRTPYATNIRNVMVENGGESFTLGALDNFWRSAENFYTKPLSGNMTWAVS